MMLGKPIADITQIIDVARQIDRIAQRRRRPGAGGDDGEVEDGERDHLAKLVHLDEPTKSGVAGQARGRRPGGRWASAKVGNGKVNY